MVEKLSNGGLSRRNFLAVVGQSIGMAAFAGSALAATPNEAPEPAAAMPEVNPDALGNKVLSTDVLVVGGGIAGLFAAIRAHDAGAKVLLVSKGKLGASGQTPFARGIFAYDPKNTTMSKSKFVELINYSALGTSNPIFTKQLADHALDRVNELKSWGFFNSPLFAQSFAKPIEDRKIPMLERIMLTHLTKANGRISGAAGFSFDTGDVYFIQAKSVVLCTGAGGFKPNGFPMNDLTHDGTCMAYRIGAKVTGKEWNDGHPGHKDDPAATYKHWQPVFDMKPNVTSVNIRHDLGMDSNYAAYINGPQTKVGGGPQDTQGAKGGPYRPAGFAQPGPPSGGDGPQGGPPEGDEKGPPPGMGGINVGGASAGLAIHKSEGLVPINAECASTIPGLYAAGDALGSYMFGAIYTQIGGSLAGSAVQGDIAGTAAAKASVDLSAPKFSDDQKSKLRQEILAPLSQERGYSPQWVTQTLQGVVIPNFVLYVKKETMLKAALAYVEELRDHHVPMLTATDFHGLRLAHETANMVLSAEMKLRASLMRTESRVSHYRLDYPDMDRKNWDVWINLYQGKDGNMRLEKQPFNTWAKA